MSKLSVTGWTEEEIEERRERFEETHADDEKLFDETFCLCKIPRQPDDYDGPQRYCMSANTFELGEKYICKHHGGAGHGNPENMEPAANISHGMLATREHLVDDFDDKDRALYEWVIDTHVDAYNLNPAQDPGSAYDLHRLAAEIVRAERGRGHILDEGEVQEEFVTDNEGKVVLDDDGNIQTRNSSHYLSQMLDRQDTKLTKLKKNLGITRKEQKRSTENENATDAVKSLAELGPKLLDRDNTEFDPEDKPWEDDD